MKLASFDIFDTTLIRKCGRPENIFYLLAHKLYPQNEAKRELFIRWRQNAEKEISATLNGRETTIADIYSHENAGKFSEYTTQELIEAEKATEAENLIANPEIKSVIDEKRKQGYTICFISDMYLDSSLLASILRREGCLQGEEKVYVSCEEGARKSTGALYEKVRSYLSPTTWEHYGDHPLSDVKKATKAGIKAHKVDTPYTIAEKKIAHSNNSALSCLAGLQRAARITAGTNAYNTLAADFVAPAYIPYVHFVLEKAKEGGIDRLYFLSRDSYILQKVAEQWSATHPGIELKYLFVSRKALLLPYLTNAIADKFLATHDKQTITGKKVEELLASLRTSSKELQEDYNISFTYGKITSKEQESDFIRKILDEKGNYRTQLDKIVARERTLLNRYLAQEGVTGKGKTAMVDVGWLGTTRLMINSILKEEGCGGTLFFYYGVRGDVLPQKHGAYTTYLSSKEASTSLTALIENYFSASPYPSTTGYKKEGENITPLFNDGESLCHNKITTANTHIGEWLAKEIAAQSDALLPALKEWGAHAIKEITALSNSDIDITPLAEAAKFDNSDFVRKLSAKELAQLALLGKRCTAYDKGSVKLTVGRRFFTAIWKLCHFSGKIRRKLYLTLKKQR